MPLLHRGSRRIGFGTVVAAVVVALVGVPAPPVLAAAGGYATVVVTGMSGVVVTGALVGPTKVLWSVNIPSSATSASVSVKVPASGTYSVVGNKLVRSLSDVDKRVWRASASPATLTFVDAATDDVKASTPLKTTLTYSEAVMRNLLTNPGAELATTPTGWVVAGQAQPLGAVALYAPAPAAGTKTQDLTLASPGPKLAQRGSRYFYGGESGKTSRLAQRVTFDLRVRKAIARGQAMFTLSGWLGGRGAENDKPELRVRFLNAAGDNIQEVLIGGITNTKRENETKLLFRSSAGSVKSAAVAAEVELLFIPSTGVTVDGYADVITLTIVP